MENLLSNYGRQFRVFVLLIVLNELVWQHHDLYSISEWSLAIIGYLLLSVLAIDLETKFHISDHQSALLIAGIIGVTQTMAINGTLASNSPIRIALFGTGIATLNYMAIYLILNANISIKSVTVLFITLMGSIWTYGVGRDIETADTFDGGFNIIVYALAIAIILGAIYSYKIPQHNNKQANISLPMTISLGLALFVLIIIQLALENVSLVAIGVGLTVIAVLLIMLWFRYINFPSQDDKASLENENRMTTAGLLIGTALIGSIGGFILQDLGNSLAIVISVFGLGWLPLLSGLLGLKAFETLNDSDQLL